MTKLNREKKKKQGLVYFYIKWFTMPRLLHFNLNVFHLFFIIICLQYTRASYYCQNFAFENNMDKRDAVVEGSRNFDCVCF